MPDISEIVEQATREIERVGNEAKSALDTARREIAGAHDRLDLIETALRRGGFNADPQAKAETKEQREYKAAFETFVRTGETANLKSMEQKALSVGSDPDGGYTVPQQIADKVITSLVEVSPIRQVASVAQISGSDVEFLIDNDEAGANWVDETSPRGETKSPQLGRKKIVAHELAANPLATQKLLEDSAINIEMWLAGKLRDKFANAEGVAFVKGTGVGQPRGFLTYPAGETGEALRRVKTGAAAGFPDGAGTADALLEMVYALKSGYRAGASWLMPRSVQMKIRKLKDGQGDYLWRPGLIAGQPDTLLGFPVRDCEDMPDMVAGSLSIAFGDFKAAYQIVDRLGMTILRDPFSKKPFVEFAARRRVGGDVVNFEALVLMETGINA